MDAGQYLGNHFLIAMPQLADPNFFHTVTYICEHNAEGALGIVINRPLGLQLGEVFSHMEITPSVAQSEEIPIYSGGPVQQDRGFVIHRPVGEWSASLQVTEAIAVTSSRDILAAMATGHGPRDALVALGYAGWGAGQLEREILDNAWLSGPADERIIFELPTEQRWEAAAALLGVDIHALTGQPGHA